MVRVEPGAFGSVVRCVTDGATRVHTIVWTFKLYKGLGLGLGLENMLYGLWENFYTESHPISQQA